jgi:hypothetical protein
VSESPLGPDPLKTARDLQGALENMTKQLRQVRTSLRRSKRVLAALTVSLVIDVLLTIVVSITAAALHSTQVSACQQGNQTRSKEVLLWTHLAALSITPQTTAKQRAADDQLLAFIRVTFAPRNCAVIYKSPWP